MELQGTGSIPKPIKGYKLVVKDPTNFANSGEYEVHKNLWIQPPFTNTNSWNNTTLFPNQELGDIATWQLIPLLDSGVWISGDMPLPEPKEGTRVLLFFDVNKEVGKVECECVGGDTEIAYPHQDGWYIWTEHGTLNVSELNPYTHWMWISAPK